VPAIWDRRVKRGVRAPGTQEELRGKVVVVVDAASVNVRGGLRRCNYTDNCLLSFTSHCTTRQPMLRKPRKVRPNRDAFDPVCSAFEQICGLLRGDDLHLRVTRQAGGLGLSARLDANAFRDHEVAWGERVMFAWG
jgi:hypothetical protein